MKINSLVKLGVAGVISFVLAACGTMEKEITLLPSREFAAQVVPASAPMPEGVVTVGAIEQINPIAMCVIEPWEIGSCGTMLVPNASEFTIVIGEPTLVVMD